MILLNFLRKRKQSIHFLFPREFIPFGTAKTTTTTTTATTNNQREVLCNSTMLFGNSYNHRYCSQVLAFLAVILWTNNFVSGRAPVLPVKTSQIRGGTINRRVLQRRQRQLLHPMRESLILLPSSTLRVISLSHLFGCLLFMNFMQTMATEAHRILVA